MHKTWKYLAVKNEQELKDYLRLQKLALHRGTPGWIMIWFFSVCALICVVGGAFFVSLVQEGGLHWWSGYGSALMMLLLAAVFVFAARVFHRARKSDILRGYLLHPNDYAFIKGTLKEFSYMTGDNRSMSRYHVQGEAEGPGRVTLFVSEFFDSSIWPFTTPEQDRQILEGDDWYDLKGKRATLPISAYFLCRKNNPKVAILVGVDHDVIVEALKRSKMKL